VLYALRLHAQPFIGNQQHVYSLLALHAQCARQWFSVHSRTALGTAAGGSSSKQGKVLDHFTSSAAGWNIHPGVSHVKLLWFMFCRLQATAIAEVAQLGEQVAEGLGVLGIGAAGLFVALWNTEKSAKAGVEQDLQQSQVDARLL
jgi:hypothetical protein